jgi:hypothetical protein
VEQTWGRAGFRLVRWWPADELFPQAMAVLVRTEPGLAHRRLRAGIAVRHAVHRRLVDLSGAVPAPVARVVRVSRRRVRRVDR